MVLPQAAFKMLSFRKDLSEYETAWFIMEEKCQHKNSICQLVSLGVNPTYSQAKSN